MLLMILGIVRTGADTFLPHSCLDPTKTASMRQHLHGSDPNGAGIRNEVFQCLQERPSSSVPALSTSSSATFRQF